MSDSPCKGCDLRHKGSHDDCDDYLEYVERREEERRRERADRMTEYDVLRQLMRPEKRFPKHDK